MKFTDREVSAWGGMALMKRRLDQMGLRPAASGWHLPQPGSSRCYPPVQPIRQWIVSIWCRVYPSCPCRSRALRRHPDPVVWLDQSGATPGGCPDVRALRHGPQRSGTEVRLSLIFRQDQNADAHHPRHRLRGGHSPWGTRRRDTGIQPQQLRTALVSPFAGLCRPGPDRGQLLVGRGRRPNGQLHPGVHRFHAAPAGLQDGRAVSRR